MPVPAYLRGQILGPSGANIKRLSSCEGITNIFVSKPSHSSSTPNAYADADEDVAADQHSVTVRVRGTSEGAIEFVEQEIQLLHLLEEISTKLTLHVPNEEVETVTAFLDAVGCKYSIMVALRGGSCHFQTIHLTGGGKRRGEMREISNALCALIPEVRPYDLMLVVPVNLSVYRRALEIVTRVKAEMAEQPKGIEDVTLDFPECCIFANERNAVEARKLAQEIRAEIGKACHTTGMTFDLNFLAMTRDNCPSPSQESGMDTQGPRAT